MVERAAREAAADLAELMLRAMTEEVSYEHTSPPCCKVVWYILPKFLIRSAHLDNPAQKEEACLKLRSLRSFLITINAIAPKSA